MSLRVKEKAMAPASSETPIDAQQTAGPSSAVEKSMSSISPPTLTDQKQTAEPSSAFEKINLSGSPRTLTNQQQTGELSSAVKDQLRKQITGPEDENRQFKLDQDPHREAVKHTLLQEELNQLREKNFNLRVDLQMAQERIHLLESERQRCKNQTEKAMKEAIESLFIGLHLSRGGSTNLGLAAEGAMPGASLPQQQPVSSPTSEKAGSTPSATQNCVTDSTGLPPGLSLDIGFGSTPSLFSPLATPPSPRSGTAAGFQGALGATFPSSSMSGDPEQTVQHESGKSEKLISTPGFCDNQEESFEEARPRRYEVSKSEPLPQLTPNWPGTSNNFSDAAPQTSAYGALLCQDFPKQGNKGEIGEERGDRERQTLGSTDTTGANRRESNQPAKPGDGKAKGTSKKTTAKKKKSKKR